MTAAAAGGPASTQASALGAVISKPHGSMISCPGPATTTTVRTTTVGDKPRRRFRCLVCCEDGEIMWYETRHLPMHVWGCTRCGYIATLRVITMNRRYVTKYRRYAVAN